MENLQEVSLRSFWRIVFDASNPEFPDTDSLIKPRLHLEINIWDTSNFTRVGHSITRIPYTIEPSGSVSIVDGVARFNGGWIRGSFNRRDLEDLLMAKIHGGPFSVTGELSEPFEDVNVSIVADVRLPENTGIEEHPIFYMAQPTTDGKDPKDAVRLIERITNGDERRVEWSISGDHHAPPRHFWIKDQPDDDPPRGFHRIRVQQDTGKDFSTYVYEIYVDVVPLLFPTVADPKGHRFYTDEQEFYIGGIPDGADGMIGLVGSISYLDFDPNSTCPGCFPNVG